MARGVDLPVELLSGVIDWVDIVELLRISHVCAGWRAVARAHPLFWRDIHLELAAVSTSALDFFLTRLRQTEHCGINITVVACFDSQCESVRSVILPEIGRNMSRIVRLQLIVNYDLFPQIMLELSSPAPRLQSLHLGVTYRGDILTDELSPALFAQSSPRLETLALTNIAVPSQPLPAFQQVKSVAIDSNDLVVGAGFASHFPTASSLRLFNKTKILPHAIPDSLSELEACDPNNLEFTQTLDLAAIARVVCAAPPVPLAHALLAQLAGPLEVECSSPRTYVFQASVRALATGRTRALGNCWLELPELWPLDVLGSADTLPRIVSARVHAELAHLAPRFALPACRVLEVVLNEARLPPPPASPMQLPALKCVTLCLGKGHPTSGVTISEDSLRTFLTHLIGPGPVWPVIRLDGVAVHAGDGHGALLGVIE